MYDVIFMCIANDYSVNYIFFSFRFFFPVSLVVVVVLNCKYLTDAFILFYHEGKKIKI